MDYVEPKSMKAQQARVHVAPAHVSERIKKTGLGDEAARQANRVVSLEMLEVWSGIDGLEPEDVNDAACTLEALPAKPVVTLDSVSTPAFEHKRTQLMYKLRKFLEKQCKTDAESETYEKVAEDAKKPNGAVPILAFERWLFHLKLKEFNNAKKFAAKVKSGKKKASAAQRQDPLFPNMMYKEPNLVADLVRAAHNQEAAEKIALALSKESQKSVNLLFKLDDSKLDQRKLVVRKNKHNMDFHFNSEAAAKRTVQGKKKNKSRTDLFVKLNHGHYDKLLALWKTTSKENGLKRTERRFHNDVFTLLQRYKTVQGHGFQMACGDDVFKKLAELFGVSFECFASPLNCFYPDYCSAFPDVDCAFGSRGSFFNFHPTQGSFHANPPFISDIMDAMVTHILTLIQQADKAGKPMSFVVVIPVWLEDRAYQRMVNSRYMDDGKRQKRGPLLISRKDHGYCDGAQHQRRDRTRESTFDTAMFFLRNKAGKAKWPRNKVTDTALLEAFALSKPTPAQVMRRKLAGRGLADADGGGGVFKGKKENQKKFKQRVPFQHVEKKRKTGEETTNETAAPVVAE